MLYYSQKNKKAAPSQFKGEIIMINLDFNGIMFALNSDKRCAERAALLSESLFYYCAGTDPTPVIALFDRFSLFIYSDILDYGRSDLEKETEKLEKKLEKHGFKLIRVETANSLADAVLYEFERDGASVFLLYAAGDAWKTYEALYGRDGIILPKCIANIRYEMDTRKFLPIEKEVSYILGYSYSRMHRKIDTFEYYGDYSEKEVKFFERISDVP